MPDSDASASTTAESLTGPNLLYCHTLSIWKYLNACAWHENITSCLFAGSVNFPFTENLLDVSQMVKLCKQRSSQPLQPHEHTLQPASSPSSEYATNPAPQHAADSASADAPSTQTPSSGQKTASTPARCSQPVIHNSTDGVHGDVDCCSKQVIVVCRRGNDSQHIVQSLRGFGVASAVDLIGGLSAWSQQLDPSFPDY